jgi:hypothetical protein
MAEWVKCPPECSKLDGHNSKVRLKRLAIRANEAEKLTGSLESQPAQLTGSLGKLTGNDYLTNRDLKIDDIGLDLSQTVSILNYLLNDLEKLNAKQLKLKTWLDSEAGSIEARARFLASKNKTEIRYLGLWLKAIVENNTETLYKHLEQSIKTTKQAIKEKLQTATIYKELPVSDRIDKSRLELYYLNNFDLKITPVSYKYLLKRGASVSSKDINLVRYFEAIANHPDIQAIDPNQHLQLDLNPDGEIVISYLDSDSSRFELTKEQMETWDILTASELSNHLEAERLEKELLNNYYEANPGQSYHKALMALQPELNQIKEQFPRISPQEQRRRYTQGFSEFITAFYQELPEQPIEPLDTWINSNYTKLDDYQELIAEHYPENQGQYTWSENLGFTSYLEAEKQGLTWDKLAKAMDSYRENLGSTWAKAPNTWINDQVERYQQAKAKAKPIERAGEATGLDNILGAMTRPNSN